MTMTFEEACSAVADLYEAAPETYGAFWYYQDAEGFNCNADNPNLCRWCAVGGVALATGGRPERLAVRLDKFAGKYSSYHVSDRGIEHAIRLLRLAAGEVE